MEKELTGEAKAKMDKKVEQALIAYLKSNPVDFVRFALLRIGEMCVEANAAKMVMSQQSDINGIRYEVKYRMSVKKVKSLSLTQKTPSNG